MTFDKPDSELHSYTDEAKAAYLEEKAALLEAFPSIDLERLFGCRRL